MSPANVRRFSPTFAFGYGGEAAAAQHYIDRRRLQALGSGRAQSASLMPGGYQAWSA